MGVPPTPASFVAGASKLVDLRLREGAHGLANGSSLRLGIWGWAQVPTPASFVAGASKLVDLRLREGAHGLAFGSSQRLGIVAPA